MTTALIFAGGSGVRMNNAAKPKQFLQLYGKEIIVHTLEQFQNHPQIDAICVVCIDSWIEYLNTLVSQYRLSKVQWVVPGGSTGQESIFNGLSALHEHCPGDSVVLVHDGVRPLVSEKLISDCIESVKKYGSGIAVAPAIETIVNLDEENNISGITDRSKCFYAKAPQGFVLQELYGAHIEARKKGNVNAIDSASLMHEYGYTLHTVPCSYENIKITTPADFYIFRALYDAMENSQVFGL